jgi:methionyl aminopeptidase
VKKRRVPGIEILSDEDLKLMRKAGLVVARALREMTSNVRVGMTTHEVDAIAVDVLAREGATSSFLGYEPMKGIPPYPGVTCLSVNEEVVHGLPSERVLAEGDLLSIDFGAMIEGVHGDAARSVGIGDLASDVEKLNIDTEKSLWAGISAARLGGKIGDISSAIERSLRNAGKYGIVRGYTGHGIGHQMHQPPDIPNYGSRGKGPIIEQGLCMAIEPMATLGTSNTDILDDDWTVVTTDGSVGAHWENTITVTKFGIWVLTEEDGGEETLHRLGLPFGPLSD